MAKDAGYTAVISHRSGEAQDATIAHPCWYCCRPYLTGS
ncbi:hypothetical protein ACNKHT_17855 [Shigella flexneri]